MCLELKKLPTEICELTRFQFDQLLIQLGKNINWDIQVSGVGMSGKIDETLHPLHPSMDRLKKTKQLGKMNQGSIEDFVSRMNSI